MTNEERDIITRLIERVSGAQGTGFGSAPGGAAPALPPIDKEADALIAELFAKYPEARYRLTQTAFVQEHALAEAQNRIQRLEYALQQAQQAAQSQPKSGGFLSGLFGGGGTAAPRPQQPQQPAWNQGAPPGPQGQYAPPPPQYAPGYQQGMFQRSGSGFLGSALTTAAGVAGGLVAGNALMNLFSPREGAGADLGGGGLGGGLGGGEAGPWGSAASGGDQGYVDQGSWTTPDQGAPDQASWGGDAGSGDQASWDAGGGGGDQSSWDSGGGGGSWDDNT